MKCQVTYESLFANESGYPFFYVPATKQLFVGSKNGFHDDIVVEEIDKRHPRLDGWAVLQDDDVDRSDTMELAFGDGDVLAGRIDKNWIGFWTPFTPHGVMKEFIDECVVDIVSRGYVAKDANMVFGDNTCVSIPTFLGVPEKKGASLVSLSFEEPEYAFTSTDEFLAYLKTLSPGEFPPHVVSVGNAKYTHDVTSTVLSDALTYIGYGNQRLRRALSITIPSGEFSRIGYVHAKVVIHPTTSLQSHIRYVD